MGIYVMLGGILLVVAIVVLLDWLAGRHERRQKGEADGRRAAR